MGISSVLGALSLIGFLIFLGGIALVVLASSQGRPVRNGVMLAVVGILAGVIFSAVGQGILIVQPTEVAVVVNTLNGQLDTVPRRGGTHVILPVVQQSFSYPLQQQTVSMDARQGAGDEGEVVARSSDGQEVRLDVSVIYSVDPANVNILHLNWQNRYPNQFVIPQARGIVRDAVSGFEAADIYAGGREALSDTAAERLRVRLSQDGLMLSDLIIRNITFSAQYADAIEQAQVAAQEAQRARLVVQQRQQEAEQLRVQAQGQRDAEITRAEGQAQATVLQARAEAEALRLVSEQIAANPTLIQYQYIQTLADNIRLALVPSNSPFLFDFESIAANPDFVAPAVPESSEVIPMGTATPAAPETGS
jgi:regulator of protease activity HflC (stomatin/prohibitin superfamily)